MKTKKSKRVPLLDAFRASLPNWLITATIGQHNNAELVVPANNIIEAGLHAGKILEKTALETFSKPFNYQIQSISQLA